MASEKERLQRALLNLHDYQLAAQAQLPKDMYEYIASGAGDEITLRRNLSDWLYRFTLQPRVLRCLLPTPIDCSTTLFGHRLALPVFTSPAGVQAICHDDGECATARACGRIGTLFGMSQHSTKSMEQVAAAAPDTLKFYQVYILKDRPWTASLLQRAVRAGYRGIIWTVDSIEFGYREADARNGWSNLPEPHTLANYRDVDRASYNSAQHDAWDQNSEQLFDRNATWKDIGWIKQQVQQALERDGRPDTSLPLVIKGALTPQDALLAVQHGADSVLVSNHGGRQLDGCASALEALPAIVEVLRRHGFDHIPILLDGGVRRGRDVVTALALGATAVGIGRPVFYSLALAGEDGVRNMLELLRDETRRCMALCGCARVDDISADLVRQRNPACDEMAQAMARLGTVQTR